MILVTGAAGTTGREVVEVAADLSDDVRRVAHREPISFGQFARDHADAFRGE